MAKRKAIQVCGIECQIANGDTFHKKRHADHIDADFAKCVIARSESVHAEVP